MVRNLSNLMRALGVPTHEDHGFRIRHAPHRRPLCTNWQGPIAEGARQHSTVPDLEAARR
jgi:hypothetical protein